MTDLTHDAIRKLLDGATPGPLTFRVHAGTGDCGVKAPGTSVVAEFFADLRSSGEGARAEAIANATLYCAAPDLARLALEQADEIARLREALEEIAKQKRTDEQETEHDVEYADFEGGYDACIDRARAALKGATE